MAQRNTISIGLVDDHQIVLDGLSALLHEHHSIRIAFSTTDPLSVEALIHKHPVDILITDIMMPIKKGNELAKEIRVAFPNIKILALSISGEGELVDQMINDADINGYALKNISKTELVKAIEKIASGGIYYTTEVLDELNAFAKRAKVLTETHLTEREIEIIKLIEAEHNNRAIAEQLFISERTVETHRKNILRKTNTNSTLSLVKFAYQQGIIAKG